MEASEARAEAARAAWHVEGMRPWVVRIACVIIPVVIWFAPLPLAPPTQHGMAIAAFMILAWATEATEPATKETSATTRS